MRTALVALVFMAIGAAVAVSVVAWEPWADDGSGDGQSLNGTLLLTDEFEGSPIVPCAGQGGYSDVRGGADVTLRDSAGAVIAIARLQDGQAIPVDPTGPIPQTATGRIPVRCEFAFLIEDVPTVDFYVVEFASRGELRYTRAELEALGWEVAFELGD